MVFLRPFVLPLIVLLLTVTMGCASIEPGYETPSITLSSFKALPGKGMVPRFEIGLHIVNPNRTELSLKGMAYTISIQGHKILAGVANDLPLIQAYGQGDIRLTTAVSLFNSIAFFADLARKQNPETLTYSFNAKLDTGTFSPIIRVNKKGTFSFESTY